MNKILKLAFIFLVGIGKNFSFAQTLTQENNPKYLRWTIAVEKRNLQLNKIGTTLTFETFDMVTYEKIISDLSKIVPSQSYIAKISTTKENYPQESAKILLDLKDSSIELFSFYKADKNSWVVDFWRGEEEKGSADVAKVEKKVVVPAKPAAPPTLQKLNIPSSAEVEKKDTYLDFRYGASLVWDYQPMLPVLVEDVNLTRKAPDFFYPIKDRLYTKDEKEAHLQLIINFYRKEKYGLMSKSIDIFKQKYGENTESDLIKFLGINSMIRSNFKDANKNLWASTISLLRDLSGRTANEELKTALLRYQLQYYMDTGDYITGLLVAKELFVVADRKKDDELLNTSIRSILHSLTMLGQYETLDQFLNERIVKSWVDNQTGLSYKYYVQLRSKNEEEVLRDFQSKEAGMQKPMDAAVLFNVAEAYFRSSEYRQAIKYYDEFLSLYSYEKLAPAARVRLALSYDLLDKPVEQVIALYRRAIDLSSDPKARYEAKLRLVGLSYTRKVNPTEKDRAVVGLLSYSIDEEKQIDDNLKKLLWMIRFRTFLKEEKLTEAHTYFNSIPLQQLTPQEGKVFVRDFSEVIYGFIRDSYKKEDYANVIKLWSTYSVKYSEQISQNQHLLYYVAFSYLNSGFFDRYDSIVKLVDVSKAKDYYPAWLGRENLLFDTDMMNLKKMIVLNQWNEAKAYVEKIQNVDPDMLTYYRGLIAYHQNAPQEAAASFEKLMISSKFRMLPYSELKQMLEYYVVAISKFEKTEVFEQKTEAVLSGIGNLEMEGLTERGNYLLVESYAVDKIKNLQNIKRVYETFKSRYNKSNYTARVSYLYGAALIANKEKERGVKLLKELMQEATTPNYIKELTKSELNALNVNLQL